MEETPSTKESLALATMNLMMTKSLEKISVSEITAACGVSRQTFYNNFKDKYDVIDWIYRTKAIDYLSLIGEDCTWQEAVIKKLEIIRENALFYKKAYRQQWFLDSFYDITKTLYLDLIKKQHPLTDDIIFMTEFYCHACVAKTGEWLRSGFKQTPEELTAEFIKCFPDELKQYLLL